jgi:hypothetical protein
MKRLLAAALIAGLTVNFAGAQAPQQPTQQTPTQIALQLNGIIGSWAQAIEALQAQNASLQQQLAAVTKERDELKAKHEPKPPPEAKK